MLFAVVAAVELRMTWSTVIFATRAETVPFRLPISDSLIAGKNAFGGLRPGDRVLAVGDVEVASRWQVHQQVIRRPVGSLIPLTVERDGVRTMVEAPSRPWPLGIPERVYTVMQNVVTAWFCIALGFFVAWRRSMDRMAWLVLLIMMGQANLLVYLFFSDEWNAWLSGLLRVTNPLWQRMGEVAWLWFGLDFCAGRRLLPWLRWPLSLARQWPTACRDLPFQAPAR